MTFEAIDFPALYETLETDAECYTNRITESTLAKQQKFLASQLKFCSSVDTREYSGNIFCILLHINGGGDTYLFVSIFYRSWVVYWCGSEEVREDLALNKPWIYDKISWIRFHSALPLKTSFFSCVFIPKTDKHFLDSRLYKT